MLQLILCHLCRSSDAYKVIQVYLFKNFKRDFLESDKSALIWYLHQALRRRHAGLSVIVISLTERIGFLSIGCMLMDSVRRTGAHHYQSAAWKLSAMNI